MDTQERRQRIIDEAEAVSWIQDGDARRGRQPQWRCWVQLIRRGVKNLTVIDSGLSLIFSWRRLRAQSRELLCWRRFWRASGAVFSRWAERATSPWSVKKAF